MESFNRDTLFLSVYDACRHRQSAVSDAAAITDTVISKLQSSIIHASVKRDDVVYVTTEVLKQFDYIAYTHYAAFHPL